MNYSEAPPQITNCWPVMAAADGVTTPTEEKAGVKQDLGANASRRILLADSSKYGAYSLFCVTPLSELTDIITDSALAFEVQQQLNAQPFQLHLV